MFDYVENFPIPANLLPQRLRALLEPVGTDPSLRVEVSCFIEQQHSKSNRETVHMLMALIPEDGNEKPVLYSNGVVAHGIPTLGKKGSIQNYTPGVSKNDYIVASCGGSLFSPTT